MTEKAQQSELALSRDEISRCNRCGFCQAVCPTYKVTGRETGVARGRNVLCRNILEGEIEIGRDLESPLFECLLCRACVAECFPAVRTHEIVVRARNEYLKRFGQPLLERYAFHNLLQNPRKLARYVKLMALGKVSKLSKVAQALRFMGPLGKTIAAAEDLVTRIPLKNLRDRLEAKPKTENTSGTRVAYFLGCGVNLALPEVGEDSIALMELQGCEVTVPENYCCGLPPYTYGDLDAARKLARHNIDLFESVDAEKIIPDCASCSSFLKDYPSLLEDDEDYVERAKRFAERVQDMSEFIDVSAEQSQAAGAPAVRVTYHEPCHLGRYQNLAHLPRRIIAALPGVEFCEMAEANWCCGGAGSFSVVHHELSMKILDRKMDNVEATEADIVVTSCPSCMLQLSYGARQRSGPRVLHLSQLLRERGVKVAEKNSAT